MERICAKCGTTNPTATGDVTEACPACGAIYAKVALHHARQRLAAEHMRTAHPQRVMWPWLAAAAVIAMSGGIVWQRAHRVTVDRATLTDAPAATPERALQRVDMAKQQRDAQASLLASARETFQHDHDAVMAQLAKWDTQDRIAGATGRIALAEPVKDLAAIARETKALPLKDACLVAARDKIGLAMDASINAYIAFMAQDLDQVLRAKAADTSWTDGKRALEACAEPETT